jgi:hypothetical protein
MFGFIPTIPMPSIPGLGKDEKKEEEKKEGDMAMAMDMAPAEAPKEGE